MKRFEWPSAINVLIGVVVMCFVLPARAAEEATAPGDRGTAPDITFPDSMLLQNGGPIIDVKRPPEPSMHAAIGDGKTDDTDALRDAYDFITKEFVAHGPWKQAHYYIYLPNGTYKVSDTIIYRGDDVGTAGKWTGKFDVYAVRFIGQNRNRTTIRLADKCRGFEDAHSPKAVLAYQHDQTVFNNAPGGNYLRDMTIDTGNGNPGAAAVYFQGANQTDIQHVTFQSGDGAGACGLWCKVGSLQGYFSDVTIKGFDIGIIDRVKGEGDLNFEYLTLRGQRVAGILHERDGLSLRRVLSDQQSADVPAIRIDNNGSQTIVLDSDFRNSAISKTAIEMTSEEGQVLLARNVTTSGYTAAITKASEAVASGGKVEEYVSASIKTLSPNTPSHTLNLPVEDTPAAPQLTKDDWVVVDDESQLQVAMNSGKSGIAFSKQQYKLSADVTVPPSVKVIDTFGAKFSGKRLVVSERSNDPLFMLDSGVPVQIEAQRDLVAHCAGGGFSNPKALPIKFFLENVNDCTSSNNFCQPSQKVFARSIDIEYRNVEQIVCNGGALWIFGFKTEYGKSAPFTVRNGGSMEILGGYCNATAMPPLEKLKPIITNDNSNISASLFVNLRPWPKFIEEKQGDSTVSITDTDFPNRGIDFGNMHVMPLFVGISAPPTH